MAGKDYRKAISIIELIQMFPDDKTAEKWFIDSRWKNKIKCARCNGDNCNYPQKLVS